MRFEKWHGCGNDFVLVEESEVDRALDPARVRALCDRRFGVGADGILVIGPGRGRRWPVAIHNADGSVAESCGNGSRCVAAYLLDRHGGEACELATAGGIVRARREDGIVGIELPAPRVLGEVGAAGATATRVDVGNPHAVVFVEDPAHADLRAIAAGVRQAAGDANVGAAAVRSRDEIALRVDERGVGETLACGTGACAAVAAAAARGLVADRVTVRLRGGTLTVVRGDGRYELWGPAQRAFTGVLHQAEDH